MSSIFLNEKALTAKERKEIPDSEFGIPETRSFPLNDESRVRSAIQMFHNAPSDKKASLAKKIISKAKKYNIEITNDDILKYK